MQLRVKTENQSATVKFEDNSVSFASFERAVQEAFSKETGNFITGWKSGYPPKQLAIPVEKDIPLSDFGIRNSDTVLVEFCQSNNNGEGTSNGSNGGKQSSSSSMAASSEEGDMVIRNMPDDNSCLFHAISYVFNGPYKETANTISNLRQIIVDSIRKNPQEYNAVVLGKPVEEYCSWISKKNSWGGAIELSIFASHFRCQILSIDIKTLRSDIFGQDGDFDQRVYLIYDGIHYDAMAYNIDPKRNGNPDYDVTSVSVTDDNAYMKAINLAQKLQLEFKYTDTGSFSIKCDICGAVLKGEKGANDHANKFSHFSFSEIK